MLFRLLPCLFFASTVLAKLSIIKYLGTSDSDKCLSFDYTSKTVVINDCNPSCLSSPQQNWVTSEIREPFDHSSQGYLIQLYNFNQTADASEPGQSEYCLAILEANGTLFLQENCAEEATLWDLGKETISNSRYGRNEIFCLNLSGGGTANNNSVLAWGCDLKEPQDNEKWEIVDSPKCTTK